MKKKKCLRCGNEFTYLHPSKKYCRPTCRTLYCLEKNNKKPTRYEGMGLTGLIGSGGQISDVLEKLENQNKAIGDLRAQIKQISNEQGNNSLAISNFEKKVPKTSQNTLAAGVGSGIATICIEGIKILTGNQPLTEKAFSRAILPILKVMIKNQEILSKNQGIIDTLIKKIDPLEVRKKVQQEFARSLEGLNNPRY